MTAIGASGLWRLNLAGSFGSPGGPATPIDFTALFDG